MKNTKEDRRSMRTRDLLIRALFVLMSSKPYDSITVQDIIDQANVGRSTFYAHYQDKEDLAVQSVQLMLDSLNQGLDESDGAGGKIVSTVGLFQHVQEQHQLFRAIVNGRAFNMFFESGQKYMSGKLEAQLRERLPKGRKPAVPLPILANHLSSSLVMLLKWWLDNKMPYSPQRMDEIYHQLVMPALRAALEGQESK